MAFFPSLFITLAFSFFFLWGGSLKKIVFLLGLSLVLVILGFHWEIWWQLG